MSTTHAQGALLQMVGRMRSCCKDRPATIGGLNTLDGLVMRWADELAALARDPAPQAAVTTHAMDVKALETARFIADLEGRDRRSQFVSRIQVAVLDAMRWMKPAPQAPAEVSRETENVSRDAGEAITDDHIAKLAWKCGFQIEKEDAEGEPTADWQWLSSEGDNMFPDLAKFARLVAAHPVPAHAAGEERAATLWCLHIVGPDDVHPAPSREHAQRAADLFNAAFADKRDLMHAVASPWPHTPASHAKSVDRFIADWMVPRGEVLAAAPPPPAGDANTGYVNAFYEMASMLGFGAMPISPKEAWEQHIRPKLEVLTAAIAPQADQAGGEVGGHG